MKGPVCLGRIAAVVLLFLVGTAHAEVASIYGGRDGLCGHKTASGEPLNCAAMTAARAIGLYKTGHVTMSAGL